jgi:hypothetical protein
MEDIAKHRITKTIPLVAKVLGKSQNIEYLPSIKYGRANGNTARNLFLTQNIGSKLTMVCNDPFSDHTKKCPIFRHVTVIFPCNCV